MKIMTKKLYTSFAALLLMAVSVGNVFSASISLPKGKAMIALGLRFNDDGARGRTVGWIKFDYIRVPGMSMLHPGLSALHLWHDRQKNRLYFFNPDSDKSLAWNLTTELLIDLNGRQEPEQYDIPVLVGAKYFCNLGNHGFAYLDPVNGKFVIKKDKVPLVLSEERNIECLELVSSLAGTTIALRSHTGIHRLDMITDWSVPVVPTIFAFKEIDEAVSCCVALNGDIVMLGSRVITTWSKGNDKQTTNDFLLADNGPAYFKIIALRDNTFLLLSQKVACMVELRDNRVNITRNYLLPQTTKLTTWDDKKIAKINDVNESFLDGLQLDNGLIMLLTDYNLRPWGKAEEIEKAVFSQVERKEGEAKLVHSDLTPHFQHCLVTHDERHLIVSKADCVQLWRDIDETVLGGIEEKKDKDSAKNSGQEHYLRALKNSGLRLHSMSSSGNKMLVIDEKNRRRVFSLAKEYNDRNIMSVSEDTNGAVIISRLGDVPPLEWLKLSDLCVTRSASSSSSNSSSSSLSSSR